MFRLEKTHLLAAGLAIGTASAATASYVIVDDFESYALGRVSDGSLVFTNNGGGPWTGWDGSGPVGSGLIAITDDNGNQYLDHGWTTADSGIRGAYRAVTPIADTDAATYYFQVRSADPTPNASYGLSSIAVPTNSFDAFDVEIALVDDDSATNDEFKVIAKNGGNNVDLATGLSINNWYDVWVVVDNATNTYDVYFGTTGDANILGTKVGEDLAFRNGAVGDLITFATLSQQHGNRQAHVDNIQFNSVAVPEPSSLALLSLGSLLIARRRRGSA
ncbi:MAG: PEP-CTERM sorting domain-containing protein [Phycisphaeraceae bacterium]